MIRLVLFLAALAAAFGVAAGLGRAVGPLERGVEQAPHTEQAPMAGHATTVAEHPTGLALAENGFRIAPAGTELRTGVQQFAFRVLGARRYDVVHEKRMHLIVVSRDLESFQHVHPTLRPDGTWTATIELPRSGVYRAFADFSAAGKRTVLGVDLFVSGGARPTAAKTSSPRPAMTRSGDALTFDVRVMAERYPGARGHLVVLRVGDLAYIHTHAESNELRFEVDLPTPGRYHAFLQYKTGAGIQTAEFPLEQR